MLCYNYKRQSRLHLTFVVLVMLLSLSMLFLPSHVFAIGYVNWTTDYKVLASVNSKNCGYTALAKASSDGMLDIHGEARATTRWLGAKDKISKCTHAIDFEAEIVVDRPTNVKMTCSVNAKHVHLNGGKTNVRFYTTEGLFSVDCNASTFGNISYSSERDDDTHCFDGDIKVKGRALMSASLFRSKEKLITVSLHVGGDGPANSDSFFDITFLPGECGDK